MDASALVTTIQTSPLPVKLAFAFLTAGVCYAVVAFVINMCKHYERRAYLRKRHAQIVQTELNRIIAEAAAYDHEKHSDHLRASLRNVYPIRGE